MVARGLAKGLARGVARGVSGVGGAAIQRAALFDGTDDYATRPSFPLLLTNITVAFWMKQVGSAQYDIVSLNANNALVRSTNVTTVSWFPNTGLAVVHMTTPDLRSAWNHIAVTQAGTSYEMYLNGVSTASGTTVPIDSGAVGLLVGQFTGGGFYGGYLRDLRIYSVAKTAGQILAIYNGTNDLTDMEGWYKFDEESGDTAIDSSGNSRDLTLVNTDASFHVVAP